MSGIGITLFPAPTFSFPSEYAEFHANSNKSEPKRHMHTSASLNKLKVAQLKDLIEEEGSDADKEWLDGGRHRKADLVGRIVGWGQSVDNEECGQPTEREENGTSTKTEKVGNRIVFGDDETFSDVESNDDDDDDDDDDNDDDGDGNDGNDANDSNDSDDDGPMVAVSNKSSAAAAKAALQSEHLSRKKIADEKKQRQKEINKRRALEKEGRRRREEKKNDEGDASSTSDSDEDDFPTAEQLSEFESAAAAAKRTMIPTSAPPTGSTHTIFRDHIEDSNKIHSDGFRTIVIADSKISKKKRKKLKSSSSC